MVGCEICIVFVCGSWSAVIYVNDVVVLNLYLLLPFGVVIKTSLSGHN